MITAETTLNYLFGDDNLNRFRKDFKDACNRNLDFEKSNLTNEELVSIIEERPSKAKRKHVKIGGTWAVVGGLLAILTGNIGYSLISDILTIITILIAIEISLRWAIIDVSAYKDADTNMSKKELVFRKAWNVIMFKTVSLAVLLLPALLLKLDKEEAYEVVMEQVEDRFLQDAVI